MPNYSEIRIGTARLDLRLLQDGDESRLFEIHSDPEFMRYWSSLPWESIEQATALIARDLREMAEGKHVRLGIFQRADRRLVGTCSLFRFDEQCRRAELGYGIARDCWRRGFMTEAVSALIDFAFSTLDLNRLEADIDPRNTASGCSLERLGFRQEGLLRDRWIVGGEVSDSAIYGLLARDWWKLRRTS
jgi:[ribosomal protein S5]-alanine N-acetyltransferase